jgi:hypothetical protein
VGVIYRPGSRPLVITLIFHSSPAADDILAARRCHGVQGGVMDGCERGKRGYAMREGRTRVSSSRPQRQERREGGWVMGDGSLRVGCPESLETSVDWAQAAMLGAMCMACSNGKLSGLGKARTGTQTIKAARVEGGRGGCRVVVDGSLGQSKMFFAALAWRSDADEDVDVDVGGVRDRSKAAPPQMSCQTFDGQQSLQPRCLQCSVPSRESLNVMQCSAACCFNPRELRNWSAAVSCFSPPHNSTQYQHKHAFE